MQIASLLFLITMGCGSVLSAETAPLPFAPVLPGPISPATQGLEWDAAFADESHGGPVHFTARYRDSRGAQHRLEEWRLGTAHLRRRTDDRIELYAHAVRRSAGGRATEEYVWQVVDLQKKVMHRVTTQGMLRAGMMYHFWSTAHVLVRPAGQVTVRALAGEPGMRVGGFGCKWFRVEPDGQAATRVCWARAIGAPIRIEEQGSKGEWSPTFAIEAADRNALRHRVFAVDATGLQVRDVDQLAAEED